MQWLENEVAVVTGAGSGIGKAVVARFVEEGAKVVAFDLSEQRLAALKEEVGDGVAVVRGDVRSLDDNRRAVAAAVSEFGRLTVFVGNAGIHDARRALKDLSDEELEQGYDEVLGVNVKGYLLGAKAAIPELMKTRGNMVFTLSTSSYYVSGGTLYVASKHAALGMVRQMANELAPTIRVNGVAPSGTATGLRAGAVPGRRRRRGRRFRRAPASRGVEQEPPRCLRRSGGPRCRLRDAGFLPVPHHDRRGDPYRCRPRGHVGPGASVAAASSRPRARFKRIPPGTVPARARGGCARRRRR